MFGDDPTLPLQFPAFPSPPCPANAIDPQSGHTVELVEYQNRCYPRSVYVCPSAFPQHNPVNGQCFNPSAPLVQGPFPEQKGNPELPLRVRQPYLFWGVVGSATLMAMLWLGGR